MTEAKCDQRIADLFTKGSHHRNISIVYLTQNVFPQGTACRDIALNTHYLVLFNNPIDRQQVATLARRIYLSTCATFMRKFEDATARPYGYLVLDLKSSTSEQDRLQTDIFVDQQSPDDGDKAIHLAANDDLPSLRKKLRRDYAQFLIDYYELQEDPVQQRILESAKTFKNLHDMNQADSIRQATKLRKDLFMDVWPNHNIETEKASEDQEDSTTS